MDWSAVEAIAEVVGLLLVVISLLFVGYQVRQNTQQLRHDNLLKSVRGTLDTNWYYHRDERAFDAFRNGVAGFEKLPPRQQAMFHSIVVDLAFYVEMIRSFEYSGLVDPAGREINEKFLLAILLTPGGMEWWAFAKKNPPMPPAALDYLQGLIDSSPPDAPQITDLQPWFSRDSDQG